MRTESFRGVVLSTLVIASLMVPAISLLQTAPTSATPEGLIPRAPILIVGNDNFIPANGVVGGSGTENDPYIIENWDINTENTCGILIGNTTAYFVIRNCYLHGGSDGISLRNVVNGKIDNNIMNNNASGIELWNSDNNLILNNLVESNSTDGISLNNSDNNTLNNNTCSKDEWSGIDLNSSSNNTLSKNTCKNNDSSGISLYASENNILTNNRCLNNSWYGIVLFTSCNNNFVSNNTCENNDHHGICLRLYSDNNTLDNNTCKNNKYRGIHLWNSSNYNTLSSNTCRNNWRGISLGSWSNYNILENNTCSNNSYGIDLGSSYSNTISNNIARNNGDGIDIFYSDNNTLTNNTCENNWLGIYLRASSNNTLTNNTCENNRYNFNVECLGVGDPDISHFDHDIDTSNLVDGRPIYYLRDNSNLVIGPSLNPGYLGLVRCDNIRVENLVLENNGQGILLASTENSRIENCAFSNNFDGILLSVSSSNTLSSNTCENNWRGIRLYYSSSNTISNNTVSNNPGHGIYLDFSSNNTLSNNTCSGNNYDGILLSVSSSNTLSSNTCENNNRGIWLLNSSDYNTLSNNTCSNNGNGIILGSSSYNILSNNTCSNNDYAIYLDESDNNLICHNNLISNANQAYDDGVNYWDDGYPSGGNYWSDYTGVDNFQGENQDIPGSDGIGDTPYVMPPGYNLDRYPLMNPWSTPDYVYPDYVYLTWVSPDTAHTINVSWRTDEDYVGEVRYDTEARGGAPDAYSDNARGTGGVTTAKFNGYIHHVELTGLEPYTTYYFICGNPDYGWSEELSFRTAPVEGKDIRFVVGGDSRSDARPGYPHPDWPEARDGVSQLMASYDPDFVIFSGDFLWNGETQEGSDTWDNWLGAMYKYWRTDSNRLIPIIPAIGNHELVYPQPSDYDPETHASNYYMIFNLPRNERWYSLNWGPDLHIVALDSEIRWTGSESWNDQLEWLGQDLLEHWDDRWKIATAHRPAFSSGHYSGDTNIQRDWIPEFDLQHLDLYFSGHDHNYQRTHPINFSISTENYQPSPENGTIYMVSAGWGAPLYGGSPRWWTAYGPDARYHFTLVDVYENGMLHLRPVSLGGEVFDDLIIQKDVVEGRWDALITATFSGGSDDAIFGVRPDATDNFDNVFDIPEPPALPGPPYARAYFYYHEQTPDKLHRSCLAPENLMEWPLRIEYADNIENITLTWSVENIPPEYNVLLYREGDLVANMRAEDNYTFEASTGNYDFRIIVGKFLPFTLELAQGWNMISFPVLPENMSPDSIFGSYYVLYRWDAEDKRYVLHADSGGFIEPDPDIEVGVGYWVYVLENENVDLLGVPVSQLTLSLRQGWNLIGPPYGGSSIADLADDPDNSVIPWAFTWNAHEKSYRMTQLLEAGKGYWVYALQPPQPPYPAIVATSAKHGDNEIRINVLTGSIPANEWAYSVSSTEGSYSWTTGTEKLDAPYVSLGTYAAGTYYVSLKHIYSGHFYFWDRPITTS